MIYSRVFCSYVYLSHFPSDFRDSLDRKLTFAPSGGDAAIGKDFLCLNRLQFGSDKTRDQS